MADRLSVERRSRLMAKIRSRDTTPERRVRSLLHRLGYRFRLHRRDLPGTPDIVLPALGKTVFVHGCFWHRHEECRFAKLPTTRPDFWKTKLEGNAARDRSAVEALVADGWRVLTVWECAIRDRAVLATLPVALAEWIRGKAPTGEIRGYAPLQRS